MRAAVAVLALCALSCEKEPRHETPHVAVPDAGRRLPAPEPDPADAELEARPDAAPPPAPLARVRLPALGFCDRGIWCAPRDQAIPLASHSAKDFQGCPTELRVKKHGEFFAFSVDRGRTQSRKDAGKDMCCYSFAVPCPPVGALFPGSN
jgi:hypothetical protein